MIHYPPRYWVMAAGLSALAGCVDTIGFVKLGGLFVSFMSGNTTRLAVGAVAGSALALTAAVLIACFVAGAVGGFLLAARAGVHRAQLVLTGVTLLLLAAAALDAAGSGLAVFLLAMAMGAENAVFERDGDVAIGLTYMTGTLVKFAQRLAAAISGGPRRDWLPFLLLWAGLVAGAFAGAVLQARLPDTALWIAAGASAALTLASARVFGRASPP